MTATLKVTSGPCPRCAGLTALSALCGECGMWTTREEFEAGGCCSRRAVEHHNLWPGEGRYPRDGWDGCDWICVDRCRSATPDAHNASTKITREMTMAEAAIAYAKAGALVFPLHTPVSDAAPCPCRRPGCVHRCSCMQDCDKNVGKHPRNGAGGHNGATSHVEEIKRWWGMWPSANIGIRPHPGIVVLDVDPRNGGGEQILAMQNRYGQLPSTMTARTGSGGLHIWLLCAGEAFRKDLAPGVDLKSHSGYLVAPPSVHVSGGIYTWINDGEIAPAPGYLVPLMLRPAVSISHGGNTTLTEAAMSGLVKKVATAPVGKRSDILNWACFRAAQRGGDLNPLVDAAVEAGLTRREAEKTAQSAFRAAHQAEVT